MDAISGVIIGIFITIVITIISRKIYGVDSLALLLAKCYTNKYLKWLTWNVWGNDDWYFEKIAKKLKERS